MTELFTQIWQSVGGPLTYLLWGYIIIFALIAIASVVGFCFVMYLMIKNHQEFKTRWNRRK